MIGSLGKDFLLITGGILLIILLSPILIPIWLVGYVAEKSGLVEFREKNPEEDK